jgi:uncharacterized membrane protein YcaP (DUF421 family)
MDWLIGADWRGIFVPDVAILEIVIRGTIIYLTLFFLLRVVLKRQSGGIGITDVLVIVLIADAAQNGMAADYRSVPEAIILVATIMFWSYALDWLGYRYPHMERFIYPRPLQLIKDGEVVRRNLNKERISEAELMSQIRLQGINDISQISEAYMERDGRVSVITDSTEPQGSPDKPLT